MCCSTPDLLNKLLHFNEIPRWFLSALQLEKHSITLFIRAQLKVIASWRCHRSFYPTCPLTFIWTLLLTFFSVLPDTQTLTHSSIHAFIYPCSIHPWICKHSVRAYLGKTRYLLMWIKKRKTLNTPFPHRAHRLVEKVTSLETFARYWWVLLIQQSHIFTFLLEAREHKGGTYQPMGSGILTRDIDIQAEC